MSHSKLLLPFLLAASAAVGQDGKTYLGQSWVGLLVTGSCSANHSQKASDRVADLTTSDRITTPAVDNVGSRGESETTAKDPNTVMPRTGELDSTVTANSTDPGWKAARQQASSLPGACRITSSTTQFALLLPNGRQLKFDQLSNGKIADRLRQKSAMKVLRVQVVGKIENGMIALDSIQF